MIRFSSRLGANHVLFVAIDRNVVFITLLTLICAFKAKILFTNFHAREMHEVPLGVFLVFKMRWKYETLYRFKTDAWYEMGRV